jgi:uncharacterized integral membrane protein (TIGR00698 family)
VLPSRSSTSIVPPPFSPASLTKRWAPPAFLITAVVLGTRLFAERMKDVVHLSPLVVAVVVGIIIGNAGVLPARLAKDAKTLGKKLLRTGVALLGFRLALGDVADLGPATIVCVVAVVLATFFGTQWLAKLLGLSKGLGLLLGTGYAICGASAIAAMEPNADAEPEEVAYALSLVTLCGTLSIAILPPVGRLFKMSPATFGVYSGAAVHDVAQVVATSSAYAAAAVKTAAVVKLSRVVMLAPMVTLTSMWRRKNRPAGDPTTTHKTPIVPLFVAAFLVSILLRTSGVVPKAWLSPLKTSDTLCLAAGMFTLGTGTSLRELKRLGGRPLILGLVSWILVAGVSLGLVLLTQP